MANDHDRVIVNETKIDHISNVVDRIETKVDGFHTKLGEKISYKVFGLIMMAVFGAIGIVMAILKYGTAIAG